MSDVTETDVRERLRFVVEQQALHETALAYLGQERMELESAVRVFDRFHTRPDYSHLLPPMLGLGAAPFTPDPVGEPRKPNNIPTMPDMIVEVLTSAVLLDEGWMEPKQIASAIRERWWPEAPSNSVGPIAWRMAKEGRLKKEGALYTIPENETPAGPAAGASEPDDSVAPEII